MTGKMADDPEIPETGAVFTFGKSKFAENSPSKFWIKKDNIVLISCGDEHTAVVTQSGRLFTFGSNEWGQLGLGHNNNAPRPSCVKVLKPDPVTAVACGRHHTLVALESGTVMAMGSNSEGQLGCGRNPECTTEPIQVLGLDNASIEKLAAGSNHSLALTTEGQVYVWGSNTEGQLGLGEEGEEFIYSPLKLNLSFKVVDISCGYYHSALVNQAGEVYCWGESEGGRLGLAGATGDTDTPRMVSLPEKVISVSCGGLHTIALTQSGRVYCWGQSTHGQLGLGTRILESSTPHPIGALSHLNIVQISTGENHSVCVSNNGRLYVWGDGRYGKLCLDLETTTNHFSPAYVTRFKEFKVITAKCGGCHTMVHGVPGYTQSEEEDDQILNESINEEVNLEARERRRSGISREESLKGPAPLPPINSSPTRTVAETTEDNDLKENKEIEKPEQIEEEKKCGKISKFFSGFRRKKSVLKRELALEEDKEEESERKEEVNGKKEDEEGNNKEEGKEEDSKEESDKSDSKPVSENGERDTNSDHEDNDHDEKAKKKVSFFSRFSKGNETNVEIIGEEPKGGKGLKNFLKNTNVNKDDSSKIRDDAVNDNDYDNDEENDDDDNTDDSIKDSENDSLSSSSSLSGVQTKPKPKLEPKTSSKPGNGVGSPTSNGAGSLGSNETSSITSPKNTVKSKTCSIF